MPASFIALFGLRIANETWKSVCFRKQVLKNLYTFRVSTLAGLFVCNEILKIDKQLYIEHVVI